MKKKTATKAVAKPAAKKTVRAPRKACATAKAAKKAVVFTLHGEKGRSVCLAGEFNDWNPTAKKMAYKARSGVYAASIRLAPGTYQYKFVVDGAWSADPENVNCVANDKGTFNSVITVK